MTATASILSDRAAGILLHPTSLPGRHGIGDLGESARRFADFLTRSGQRYWQILPLGPVGYGNSPYQCLSSMAGNPLLISLDALADEGWIERRSLADISFAEGRVDFAAAALFKERLLREAAERFRQCAASKQRSDFEDFCAAEQNWLDPFAKFMALKEENNGIAWTDWTRHSPDPEVIDAQRFIQFSFFRQWSALKSYCNQRAVFIVGDVPIFVAHDSADVWRNPELFDLDRDGHCRTVAGVPPDYFSATGQLWGNPIYRWDRMRESGYAWWIERMRAAFRAADVVRLDHFRGFEKYYAIAAGARDATQGDWIEGPGEKFFTALRDALGEMPIIAEDLGLITPEVHALRDRFGFPGMRILQFAFASVSASDSFKPYNYIKNCVVYTGTHDNDTVAGWFRSPGAATATFTRKQAIAERDFALRYLNSDGREIHWDFIRAALASTANTAIVPLQDVLGLGSEARMNVPAKEEGNWTWRFRTGDLTDELAAKLRQMTAIYGRCD